MFVGSLSVPAAFFIEEGIRTFSQVVVTTNPGTLYSVEEGSHYFIPSG